MPRPFCCRIISGTPPCVVFKPAGVPLSALEEICLTLDELESLRLADMEGLYHEAAAQRMNVSRQTFGRIIESARRKIASALVKGMAIRIEGGEVVMANMRKFQCSECQHVWELPHGTGRPAECPACQCKNIHRAEEDRGYARAGRRCRRGQNIMKGVAK
jgi:predicted DNA-binding protein (UPF0251 family)